MNKIYTCLCLFVFILFSLFPIASAQLGNAEEQIEGAVDNLERNVSKIKEFTEKDKWEFIGAQWKEFLLKNKAVTGIDAFFTKINIVFVILFAREWSISLDMFFIFLLWLFTLISLIGYVDCFLLKSGVQKFLIALALTIVLAQARLFYLISLGLTKIFLFKPSAWWRFVSFVLIVVAIIGYFALNKSISKSIKKSKEKQKVEFLERKTKNLESFKKGIESAA